jgi:hypothetical protein
VSPCPVSLEVKATPSQLWSKKVANVSVKRAGVALTVMPLSSSEMQLSITTNDATAHRCYIVTVKMSLVEMAGIFFRPVTKVLLIYAA